MTGIIARAIGLCRRITSHAAATPLAVLLVACSDPPTGPPPFELEIVSGDQQAAEIGTRLPEPLVVRVTHRGMGAEGLVIHWTAEETGELLNSTGLPSITDAEGYARAYRTVASTAGQLTTTVRIEGRPEAGVQFTSFAQKSGALRLSLHPETSGNEQIDSVFATLRPFRALVTDYLDRPVAGVVVTWGHTGVSDTTDALGVAEFTYTASGRVGLHSVGAEVRGLLGSPAKFTATTIPGNPVAVSIVEGADQIGVTDSVLSRFRVEVVDAYGNAVPDVPVSWAIATGGGSVDPAVSVTAADPIHGLHRPFAATVLTLDSDEGASTVTATAQGLPGSPVATFSTTVVSAIVSLHPESYWDCWYYGLCSSTFVPRNVTINAGNSVAWRWSYEPCDVVFEDDPAPPASTDVRTEGVHIRRFDTPGSYRYRCTEHSSGFESGMVGVITVQPGD